MLDAVKQRWNHAKSIGRTWWWLVPLVYSLFWGLDSAINKWDFGIKDSWNAHTSHLPKHWQEWLIGLLLLMIVSLTEGSFREHWKIRAASQPPPNLSVEWGGLIFGPLFLGDDGVWSASPGLNSSDAGKYRYIGIRIRVSNPHISGKKVGPARAVTGLVEFTYDTGLSGWRASPAAWVHESLGSINIDVDHDKELIVAVGAGKEWSVVSNVRRNDGLPKERTAMQFRDAPWNSGSVRVSIVHNGEATSREYEWNDAYSGLPTVRPITSVS